jgi:small-conductance mechanosensitive channel
VRVFFYLLRHVFAQGSIVRSFERTIAVLVWGALVLHVSGLLPEVVDYLDEIAFHLGKQKLTLWQLLEGIFWVVVTLLAALWLSGAIEARLMRAESLHSSLRVVFARLAKALLVLIAVLMVLPLVGIDLTVLSVFGGAIGVGLGFGLQKIGSNYVSGFIILLDRSIRIGDLITADNFYGEVKNITTRYVVVRSADGREAIIPNEMLITTTVLNHSYSNRQIRLPIQVQVGYKGDPERAMQLMEAAASKHPRVLADPPPTAFLARFADSGIELELGVWIDDPEAGTLNIRSELNLAIWRAFQEAGIEIPYPQREVRVLPGESGVPG